MGMIMQVIHLAIVCDLICELDLSLSGEVNDEDRLFYELFKKRHYHRHSRPVTHVNESVSVAMGISVVRIVEVVSLSP